MKPVVTVRKCSFLLASLLLAPVLAPAQDTSSETATQHEARMAWWRQAKFGMFIHWGLYAIPARGEWVMNRQKIPVAEYAKLAERFNPVKFNAEQWVRFAKDSGMKYIVITAKHHDGFAMFGSKVSSYNIVDATPFKRDPLKELTAACARHGIKFGVYYSQAQDWHHPGGAVAGGPWDPSQQGDFDHYLHTLAMPQVKELLTGYHPAVLWFDTPKNMTPAYAREFVRIVRNLRPQTIINSRLMYSGRVVAHLDQARLDELRDIGVDYLSYPDRTIPARPAPSWGQDWETCMTLNDSWGYNARDHNWKTPQKVVQMLARVVSKGGNFLLNFGPTAEGELPAESMKIMRPVGAWLRANGEAIYGAGPSALIGMAPSKAEAGEAPAGRARKRGRAKTTITWVATTRPTDRATGQPAKTYVIVFEWPASHRLEIEGVAGPVSRAYLLATRASLRYSQRNRTVSITLPAHAPDPLATVVCLEFARRP